MDDAYVSIADIINRVKEIDELLFGESSLSDMERKTLETEREDLLYYLE